MKSIRKIFILSALVAASQSASSQNTYSGYFLDNYTYRYEMNPAFGNEKNFVSMPAIGNLNIGVHGNLHLNSLLYNVDGKTSLFTNPKVGVAEAMSKFSDRNKLGSTEKINVMSVGFKALGGYNTVTVGVTADVNAAVPKAFFSLAKEGISNQTYDIRNLGIRATGYASIALNHSHDIKQVPGLRVGATAKILLGAGNLDMQLHEADLTLGKDTWTAKTNADIYASITGFRFDTDTYTPEGNNGGAPREYVSGGNLDDGFGLNGGGFGIDLGAEYKWRDFRFSFAALDLGFISWGTTQWASTNGTQTFTTDAYTFSADGSADNAFKNEFKNLKDDAAKLYQLKDMGTKGSYRTGLATTLNFGVNYELPYYRKLHFGLLNSTRINGDYTWTQFRLSANVAPVKCFSADVNMVAGTFGVGFGWLLNLNTTGFNLFVGMDHTLGKVAKQFVPLNSNGSLNFGINFPF